MDDTLQEAQRTIGQNAQDSSEQHPAMNPALGNQYPVPFNGLSVLKFDENFPMPTSDDISSQLPRSAWMPPSPHEELSQGWICAPHGHSNESSLMLEFSVGGNDHIFLHHRRSVRKVDTVKLDELFQERIKKEEQEIGYMPGRKACKAIKEDIYQQLLPSSPVHHEDTPIWIDVKNRYLIFGTTKKSAFDNAFSFVHRNLNSCDDLLKIESLFKATDFTTLTTRWLQQNEITPIENDSMGTLSMGKSVTLRKGDSKVSFTNLELSFMMTRDHLQNGMYPEELAMEWISPALQEPVTFILASGMTFKKIKSLNTHKNEDDPVISSLVIMVDILGSIIQSIVDHVGAKC